MRQIGESLDKRDAERFQAFLRGQNIAADLRDDDADRLSIWVLDEDQLSVAESHFQAFRLSPAAKEFDAKPIAPAPKLKTPRARNINVRSEVFSRVGESTVTMSLIVLSLAFTAVLMTPATRDLTRYLFFSEFGGRAFPEIAHGQIWRLITPIFLHGGILHLFFNMLWLIQLGAMTERNEGARYYLALVLISAALINTGQYLISGPAFLGMSGIVYMLLGYVWMMAKYKAGSAYWIAPQTVSFMLIWLVVCLVGLIPGVANAEHVLGLAIGVAWGYLRSGQLAQVRRKRRYRG